MRLPLHTLLLAALTLTTLPQLAPAQTLSATPDHPTGLYNRGETVRFQIQADADLPTLTYELKSNGLKSLQSGPLTLKDQAATFEFTPTSPGSLLLELKAKTPAGKDLKAAAGALVDPENIKPSAPRPEDFDTFWNAQLDALAKIPANPQLQEIPNVRSGITYYKITLDNIAHTHIQGQLARPAEGGESKKFPALLIVQWAGVYALDKNTVTNRAAQGFLTLNIEPHDLPIDESPAFYKAQDAGPLHNYPSIGAESRDTSYFLRMYLACYRAAEYLASRPDWDGKTLIVTGTSMGGQQCLITAGLSPHITAATALVPAGCDLTGALAGRDPGFPKPNLWYGQPADPKKALDTARYFDVVNFAPRIHCPILVGMGLLDTTCPAVGIYAAINQLNPKTPRELVILPRSQHQEDHGSQSPFNKRNEAWLKALQKSDPAPIPPLPAKTPDAK
jgi:cephalosporin-C deacetylase